MGLTALVKISGATQVGGRVIAYVGTSVSGMQEATSNPPFGPYAGTPMYQISLYANDDGETMTFSYEKGAMTTAGAPVYLPTARSTPRGSPHLRPLTTPIIAAAALTAPTFAATFTSSFVAAAFSSSSVTSAGTSSPPPSPPSPSPPAGVVG